MDGTRWDLHEYVICFQIPGQGQGHEPSKVWKSAILKTYLLRHLLSDFGISCCILIYNSIIKFGLFGFLIYILVWPSRDLEVDLLWPWNFFQPILMKLGMWMVLNETYMNMQFVPRSEVEVKVTSLRKFRNWPFWKPISFAIFDRISEILVAF